MAKKVRPTNSAVVIARLLDTEGFTDFTAARVESWWKRNRAKSERERRQIERVEKALSELAAKMTTAERLVLGKFIGMRSKACFETGVAIGLTVSAVKTNVDVATLPCPDESIDFPL